MNIVREEFNRLTNEWGLDGWTLEANSRLSRSLGRAILRRKVIEYQPRECHPDELIEVIRHEVAHAIAWEIDHNYTHDVRWRKIARMVGCHPRATAYREDRIAAVAASRERK